MRRIAITLIAALSLIAATPQKPALNSSGLLAYTVLEKNIVYMRLGSFTAETGRLIRPTIEKIAAGKPRGLILDFRNSQGGEDFSTVHALLESFLPKGIPYMRFTSPLLRTIKVTAQPPLLKRSTPIVVLRNQKTVNEPDILIYVLQKIRKAGVIEFTPHRSALARIYKQHSRMDNYRPIKEGVFFVTPDLRIIGDEGGGEEDVVPRAVSLVREMSPWDEPKK